MKKSELKQLIRECLKEGYQPSSSTLNVYKTWLSTNPPENQIEFVDKVYQMCEKHYEDGGDTVVETMEPADVLREFKSLKDVIEFCDLHVDQQMNARWGEDSDSELTLGKRMDAWKKVGTGGDMKNPTKETGEFSHAPQMRVRSDENPDLFEGNVAHIISKPVKDTSTGEWVVKWMTNGKRDEQKTYYTDDLKDAQDTAVQMQQHADEMNKKSLSENDQDDFERNRWQAGINRYNKSNPSRYPCPTCKTPNALSAHEKKQGYQCSRCADAEEGVNESAFNIEKKELTTRHDLDKTPRKTVTANSPLDSSGKLPLKEMSINRHVNSTDKESGITGYTSHVTKCRGCGGDSNTLRKTVDGREGVYCGKECADKPIEESAKSKLKKLIKEVLSETDVPQGLSSGDRVEITLSGIIDGFEHGRLRVRTDQHGDIMVEPSNVKKLDF